MKLTAPFNLNPLSKFHVPLPRTPRQSQQLLNALTSSFRRELDRAHPPTASSSDENAGANNAYSGDHLNEEHAHSAAHATDKHIRALLDNPLFRVSPSRNSVRSGPQSGTDGSRIQKEPMAIFDELVASGSATVGSVSDCLNWQLLLASRQSGERFVKELRDSRAGSRTFSWWSSSDSSTRVSFLKNNRAVRSTCKFMAAEGLRESVLTWLRILRDRDFGGSEIEDDLAENSFKYILGNFLNGEIECGGGLVSALRFYLDACKILMSTADITPALPLKKSLGAPAGYLLGKIETNSRRNPNVSIPADVYDRYANMVSALALGKLQSAVISIYHPTRPDAVPFVRYLRRLSPTAIAAWTQQRRTKVVRVGFDALRILSDSGESRDCLFLANFLEQHAQEIREAQKTYPSSEELLRPLSEPEFAI
ncbi:hypothetical protein BDW67DRAFT_185103 [Aspergillus spinulosporus]